MTSLPTIHILSAEYQLTPSAMNDGVKVDIFDKNRGGKALIVKSNKIIEASYRFTVSEQKIIAELLSLIQKEDTEFKRYIFRNKDLYVLLGIDHWSREEKKGHLLGVIDKLQKRTVFIEEGDDLLKPAWVETPIFNDVNQTTSVRISYELKPYLLQLTEYTSFLKKLTEPFTGMYSFRFFEMFKRHEPHKGYFNRIEDGKYVKTIKLTLTVLRDRLRIKDSEYRRFYDLKLRVILPSQRDVNEKSDISFKFQPRKSGRSIDHILFLITSKNPKGLVGYLPKPNEKEEEKGSLLERLKKLGVSDKLAGETLEKMGAEELEIRVEVLEELDGKEGLRNPDGALSRACSARWKSNKRKNLEKKSEKEKEVKEKKELEEAEEKLKEEIKRKKAAAENAKFSKMSNEEKYGFLLKEYPNLEFADAKARKNFKNEMNLIISKYTDNLGKARSKTTILAVRAQYGS